MADSWLEGRPVKCHGGDILGDIATIVPEADEQNRARKMLYDKPFLYFATSCCELCKRECVVTWRFDSIGS